MLDHGDQLFEEGETMRYHAYMLVRREDRMAYLSYSHQSLEIERSSYSCGIHMPGVAVGSKLYSGQNGIIRGATGCYTVKKKK